MPQLTRTLSSLLMTLLAATVLGSCSSGFYKRSADREVFGILRRKSSKVPNSGQDLLDITPPEEIKLDHLRSNMKTVDFLGDRAQIEKDARVLSLADALSLGVHHNRTYLGEKELVYLDALDLTLRRHQFTPIFYGNGSGTITDKQVEAGVNNFITESTLTATGSTGFSLLTRAGTRIATDLSTDFLRFLTGDIRNVSDSSLAVTLTQPFLRGAGYLAVSEALTQSERNVLYSIRDFTQYRKTFTVDLTSQYYRVLQAREAAKNAYLAAKAFKSIVERETAMMEANLRTRSSLGQLQQAEITYQRRWLTAIRSYEQQLDELKIALGIPVSQPVILDQKELEKLQIINPPGTLDEALQTAMTTRLDLWNSRDEVDDAARKVRVAHQDLLPTVDSLVTYKIVGDPGRENLNVDGRRRTVTTKLDVDLHLDQKAERNTLRAAQITEQKARRQQDLTEENVRQQIRADWRDLELARKQYELAQKSLALSQERLEIEEAFMEEGQGTARDLIDAQQDLIEAQDLIIASLVTHTTARLQLFKDMGILFIKKDGSWAAVLEKEKPKGE